MAKLYFRNQKTNKRYEVVRMDKEKNEVTLRGETAEFVEPYDKERFKQLGYVLERVDEDEMAE
tara:strand:+ start:6260 stop:6448 length:189 start_codon:yes stop_codon:yes gene_type:complete